MSASEVVSDAAHTLGSVSDEEKFRSEHEKEMRASSSKEPMSQPPPPVHNLVKAMAQLQSPFVDPNDVPILRLASIRLAGLTHTRTGFLASLCRPYVDPTTPFAFLADWRYGSRMYFPMPGEPTTLPSILQLAKSISTDISQLELAKDIAVEFEPSKTGKDVSVEDVDLVLNIKPVSRFFLRTSTSVGNSEGTASVQGKIRNVFGGAETLEGSATLGTRTKHSYNLVFATPVLACPDLWANLMAVSQHRDLSGYIRAHEGQHQLRTAIMYARGDGARHELAYEASHRHFHHLHPDASIAIRRLARPSFKSAISYTFEKDTRDNTYTTTLGTYFRSFTELAGFGGDTSYFKTETQASLADVMVDGWSWSLGAKFGYMMPLDGKPACLSDRFMLGGPTCIRMFRLNSLGPKYKYDSLGGDAFWALGASLLAPIPARPQWPLKLHAFTNIGQLAQVQSSTSEAHTYTDSAWKRTHLAELTQPSASAGIGLLFQQGPVRLELNFGLPLLARAGDGTRKGLQFGIGIDFL